ALVAADRSAESAFASLKYLFLGTIGASLYLTGVGYAFLATGTLNMLELQTALAEVGYDDTLVRTAYGLVVVGLGLKVAQFPLHTWQPDAYQRAPDSVTMYISALVSTVAAYALARITYTVFTVEFLTTTRILADGVLVLAGLSIVVGSALAAVQTDLKRLFAYSSIAQFGIVVAAVALANETALLGGMVHLLGHGLMKGGLFLAVGMFGLGYGVRTVDDLAGLGTRAPYTAGGMAVLGLTLVGVPPSVGFVGKWYVAVGAVESGRWPIAIVIFLSTLLTLAYVARILERLYFASPEPARSVAPGDEGASAVAADGSGTVDERPERSEADAAGEDPAGERLTPGMLAVLLLAAVLAVALGFGGVGFAELFDPVLGRFFT
ncbi:MAG: proton-conducting transporter membrane subunit, partial [Haloferacaceae archaeon]